MLGYVTVGTNDLARAAAFYDAIAKEMGVARMMEFPTFIAWGEMAGCCARACRDETLRWRSGDGRQWHDTAGSQGHGAGPSPAPNRARKRRQ